jgi:hypothetical protein
MAAVAGFNLTSYNDLVNGGIDVGPFMAGMNRQARVYSLIAQVNPAVKAPTWRLIVRDLISVTATLTETDEASYTSFTTSASNITPAMYPVRSFVSDEMMQDGVVDVFASAMGSHVETILNNVDTVVLANITSITNTSSHTGVAMTKAFFEADALTFAKQNPDPGVPIFLGSYRQTSEIIAAYANAGGAAYSVPGVVSEVLQTGITTPYRGMAGPIPLFQGAVPTTGADSNGAFLVSNVTLALGIWKDIFARAYEVPGRVGLELLTYMRYGTGMHNETKNALEVLSLA